MVELNRSKDDVAHFPIVQSNGEVAAALVAIVRRLSTAPTLREIMEIVTHAGRSLLRADGMTFVLRDGDLCYYAEEDAISPLWKDKRFPMSACISGWCMIERKAAVIPDIRRDPRIPQDAYRPTFVRSLAMVPVRQEDPIAAIGAYWGEIHRASEAELELMQTVANCAALAIANVQLKESERRATENGRRESMLASELSHRVKNSFTVIDAIARQSANHAESLASFSEAFSGRLRALTHTVDWLIDPGPEGVAIETVVEKAVAPFRSGAGVIAAEGPALAISSRSGVAVALILHELATNAIKYGALGVATGTVRIAWTVEKEASAPRLRLTWVESGGPAVAPPARQGFGTTLLDRMVRFSLKGRSELTFAPDGLRCVIAFPIPESREAACS